MRGMEFALGTLPLSQAQDGVVRPLRLSSGRSIASKVRRRHEVQDLRSMIVRATIFARDENTKARPEVEEIIARKKIAWKGGDGLVRMGRELEVAEIAKEGEEFSGDGLEEVRSKLGKLGHDRESRVGSEVLVLPAENGKLESSSSTFGGVSKSGPSYLSKPGKDSKDRGIRQFGSSSIELKLAISEEELWHDRESSVGSDVVVLPGENRKVQSSSSTFGSDSKSGHYLSKTGTDSKDRDAPKFGSSPTPKTSMPEISVGSRSGRRRRQLPTVVHPLSIDELLQKTFSGNESLPSFICDAADNFITSFLNPLSSHKEYVDPAAVLRGLFAPVPETPPTKCRVVHGQIPPDLAGGVYLRNGPNATAIHEGDGYHVFDGDGMLHAVKLSADAADGIPIYCSRFVQTSRFRQEKEAGKPLMGKFFGATVSIAGVARMAVTILRSVLGVLDIQNGYGLSNTNVCYFNGRILSLSEDDMPYIIRVSDDGDLSTVGRFTLPSKTNMCAHPKFDPVTGEMYAFSLNMPLPLPPFSVFRLSADGTKSGDVPVPLLDVPLVHDFAMTPRFVIFPDSQLVIRPWAMLNGEMPLVAEAGKTARLCLLPRYGLPGEDPAAAMWFDAPGVNCIHYVNAWEEGRDQVVIVASVLSPLDRALEFNCSTTLTRIRINTKTGQVSTRPVCAAGRDDLEFGVVNPNFAGKKTRYAYLATGIFPGLTGVVKVDISQPPESAIVAMRDFAGLGCYGGEPFFVPATGSVSEDDGYLLCLVGNEKKDVSHLLIMDAQSPSLRVVAAVKLPSRVPAGFHGCFVTADQLAKQRD